MKKRVVLDIDGVLADFTERVKEEMGTPETEDSYSLERWYPGRGREIMRIVESPLTYASLNPLEDAKVALQMIKDLGFSVVMVTARPAYAKGVEEVTKAWVALNFRGLYDGVFVVPSEQKPAFIASLEPALAVDDSPDQVMNARSLGVNAVLFLRHYNVTSRQGLPCVNGWGGVASLLEALHEEV